MIPLRDDNPTSLTPVVSYGVLAACVLTFLWEQSLPPGALQAAFHGYGLVPAVLLEGQVLPPGVDSLPSTLTVISSMFLHGGWMHLIGNMMYLWIFADNIEDILGHGRFVVFYLVCGIIAALSHAIPNADSVVPMVGASGAISGVLGAYLVKYPKARVLVLIPLGFFTRIMHLPAVAVLGFWFVLQLIQGGLSGGGGGGVAFGAHIGGFIAGVVLIPIFAPGRRR